MPLDGTNFEIDARGAEAFKRFGRAPTLRGLAYALRHREVWPAAFRRWDYSHSDTCAIGLTHALLKAHSPWWFRFYRGFPREMTAVYGISYRMENAVFFGGRIRRPAGWRGVMPEDVAEAIDLVLAERAVPSAGPNPR